MLEDRPQLLRRKEVAELLNVSPSNIYRWLERRGITPVASDEENPVGRQGGGTTAPALYDRAEVERARDEWLADKTRRAADERRRASALARVEGT